MYNKNNKIIQLNIILCHNKLFILVILFLISKERKLVEAPHLNLKYPH